MLKEIYEQPSVAQACLDAYLNENWNPSDSERSPFRLNLPDDFYRDLAQIHIVSCGTSFHASLVGQYLLEQIAGIPTRVKIASEFRYAPFPLTPHTLTIGVTQSGETADTLSALELEQQRRSSHQAVPYQPRLLGITNQPNSSITRLVNYALTPPAGPEVGVAATKSFIAELLAFYCLALDLAYRCQAIGPEQVSSLVQGLRRLPGQIAQLLEEADAIAHLAKELVEIQDFIVLGRGINYPIALEGALKLKETSYTHAEGYAAGEFLHGPIAMLDETVGVIAIAMPGQVYDKVLSNVQRVKDRGPQLIGITAQPNPNSDDAKNLFAHELSIPLIDEWLSPILTVIPLQLLAYYITVHRGLNVDQPRSLTKAVTSD